MKNIIKKNLSKLFFLACILFVSLGSMCPPSKTCEPIHTTDVKDLLTVPTDNLETDIFLDATLSMQGFITEGTFSFYQQTIPILERSVIKNNGKAHFYKFGTTIKELPERSYSEFDKKSFYTDSDLNKKTSIEKVIEKADTNHLTIVVTDLFQEKADINQLSELIKKKFISNNYAVGILAVKSQFNGMIYDVGTNNYSFKYANKEDAASFRPFYLIAFGLHADVARYFDTLVNGEMSSFPAKERIIFSRFLDEKPVTFTGSKITETKGMNEVTGVIVKTGGKDNSYKEFKVKDKIDGASFSAETPFQPLQNITNYSEQLAAEIQPYSCSISKDPKNNSEFVVDSNISNILKVQASIFENQKLQIKVDISASKLEAAKTYCFRIILRPKEYSLPAWTNEWNMTGEQIEIWHKTPLSFDGTKTYNFAPFLQTLWETTRQAHNPKVADFYCYFRRG